MEIFSVLPPTPSCVESEHPKNPRGVFNLLNFFITSLLPLFFIIYSFCKKHELSRLTATKCFRCCSVVVVGFVFSTTAAQKQSSDFSLGFYSRLTTMISNNNKHKT